MSKNAPKPIPEPAPKAIPDDVVARLEPVVKRVFSEGDFHRVDMRSIARDAGMSFTTIYRHFSDKERLLFWFIAYWLTELQQLALEALDSKGTAIERIRRYLLAHFSFYERNPEVGRIIFVTVPLERWMRDDTYRCREPTRRLHQVVEEGQQTDELRSDVKAEVIVDLTAAIFNRAFIVWEFKKRVYSLTGQNDVIRPLIESALLNPRPTSASRRPRRAG